MFSQLSKMVFLANFPTNFNVGPKTRAWCFNSKKGNKRSEIIGAAERKSLQGIAHLRVLAHKPVLIRQATDDHTIMSVSFN